MAFEGIRSKLRSLADSGSETTKRAAADARREAPDRILEARQRTGSTVQRVAPATGLEGNRKPREPTTREKIAARLQGAGEMRKPIPDANLEPGSDPRWMESFARGDATVDTDFGSATGDEAEQYFGSGDSMDFFGVSDYQDELADERDHEGGLYAFEDEREDGILDDGVSFADVGVDGRRWF